MTFKCRVGIAHLTINIKMVISHFANYIYFNFETLHSLQII